MSGYIFSNSEAERVADTVRSNEGEVQRRLPPRPKKYVTVGGGSSGSCPEVHEFSTSGLQTSGTFDVTYNINSSSETLTFDWDCTAAEFETELLTHTELSASDIVKVDGGPFPLIAIYVEFAELTAFPTINISSLDAGSVMMAKFSTSES